ncbi:hypothetical protein IFM89_018466 [Coptis chinensis]|uniref:Uncharacterized protein n=1 Tax=Coptis chinensis TaxID=261450 RepID=A0A835LMN7_9MAGN|nr:hypothetical protein IFM89_018466 [Coptis chinensis]
MSNASVVETQWKDLAYKMQNWGRPSLRGKIQKLVENGQLDEFLLSKTVKQSLAMTGGQPLKVQSQQFYNNLPNKISSQHGQALKLVPTPSSEGSLKVEYEAALLLQKVYKSFRTRRKLADFAVLVEQQWSKLLDCAELKRSSLSFFDIENTETSVSRWSRARTRASRVGIGLSKDEKAQKLALQHWLEAIDPRHRYGHNLQYYYATWLRSESQQPFFYWLDIGDGKEVNLVDECPRSRLIEQCIKYLDPIERKAYEVTVEDGKFYKQGGEPLDTMDAKWMFVLSTSKTLYVGRKRKGIFQHSSFLAGGATSAAGKLVVENGVLKAVWPHSGHYRPTEQNFQEFITFLKEHNVDLTDVRISPSNEDQERSSKNAGETVLEAEDISARNIKTEQARAKPKKVTRARANPKAFLRKPKVLKMDPEAVDILKGSVNYAKKGNKLNSQESQLAEGYETDSLDGEEDKDYMVSKRKLFGGEREDKEYTSLQELIPRRFISEKGMVSYQLGKQLSRNWATGAGPRIGCVRDKPSNFQLRLLNQVSL